MGRNKNMFDIFGFGGGELLMKPGRQPLRKLPPKKLRGLVPTFILVAPFTDFSKL